jgi:hypothetical protein
MALSVPQFDRTRWRRGSARDSFRRRWVYWGDKRDVIGVQPQGLQNLGEGDHSGGFCTRLPGPIVKSDREL